MYSANCYLCEQQIATFPNTVGSKSYPLGVCKNCNVFACGFHAQRDFNIPGWMCIICDQNLLSASAIKKAEQVSTSLETLGRGFYLFDSSNPNWQVTSLDEFVRRRPGYEEDFFSPINDGDYFINFDMPWKNQELKTDIHYMNDEMQKLMSAAAYIVLKFEIPNSIINNYMIQIKAALTYRGNWGIDQ